MDGKPILNIKSLKEQVYEFLREQMRGGAILPGGRLAISDVLPLQPFPAALGHDPDALCGCVSGAASVEELQAILALAGFDDIRVVVNRASREFIRDWAPGSGIEDYVASARVQAVKPPEGCGACTACDGL